MPKWPSVLRWTWTIAFMYHNVFFSFAALNMALKQEVERLKLATGEVSNPPSGAYNGGLQHIPYDPSFASSLQQPVHHQAIQLQPKFQQSQPGASSNHLPSHQNSLPAMMEQDPIGGLQGLDISKSSIVKLEEGSSVSADGSRNVWHTNPTNNSLLLYTPVFHSILSYIIFLLVRIVSFVSSSCCFHSLV